MLGSGQIKLVNKTLVLQALLGLFSVVISGLIFKTTNAILSSALGCSLVIIPTLVYIKIGFAKGMIVLPSEAFRLHKKAMVAKFTANLVLFLLVIILYRKCNFLILFLTYIVTLSSNWLNLVINKK